MTLTLIRHKGELKPFGRLLAMKMLLAKNKQLGLPNRPKMTQTT